MNILQKSKWKRNLNELNSNDMKQIFNWSMLVGIILLITGLILLSGYLNNVNIDNVYNKGYNQGYSEALEHKKFWSIDECRDTTIHFIDAIISYDTIYVTIKPK